MAVQPLILTGPDNNGIVTASWADLANGDTGSKAQIARYPDKTVQVVGTFGAGGSVAIEGSNDGGTTWGACADPQGTVIALQDSIPVVIAESPIAMRPNVTAGDGTTALRVIIAAIGKGV